MADTPGVFAGDADKWYKFYRFAARTAKVERLAYSNDPVITLTEHRYNEHKAVVIAVNNSPEERKFVPEIAAAYSAEYIYGKPGSIPANSGVILQLVRN